MNTAVRRLLIIACVASALPLFAQTTKKTTTKNPTPQPAIESATPAPSDADIPKADQAATARVSADTDKEALSVARVMVKGHVRVFGLRAMGGGR